MMLFTLLVNDKTVCYLFCHNQRQFMWRLVKMVAVSGVWMTLRVISHWSSPWLVSCYQPTGGVPVHTRWTTTNWSTIPPPPPTRTGTLIMSLVSLWLKMGSLWKFCLLLDNSVIKSILSLYSCTFCHFST